MNKDLIIVSAGKFGREIYSWAQQAIAQGAPWQVKGFLDDRSGALDEYNYEPNIIGSVQGYKILENDVFIGGIGDPRIKVEYFSPIVEKGGRFINLIHPLANIGKNVKLGSGIVMAPYAQVTCDAQIGNFVSFGSFSNSGHDTVVGNWCQISSHCGINGNAILGEGVFLGSHVCVVPEINVGDWAFVGAGSVLLQDVSPRVKVFGNPAMRIGRVDRV